MISPLTNLARSLSIAAVLCAAAIGGCRTAAPPPPPPPAPGLSDLEWLVGTWRCTDEDGAWIEERWSAPAGDAMVGTGRTVREGRLAEWEFIRILQRGPGDRAYLASPGGDRPPIEFRAVPADAGVDGGGGDGGRAVGKNQALFENLSHDFPQRIAYLRTGDQLSVSISGEVQGKQNCLTWRMLRVP